MSTSVASAPLVRSLFGSPASASPVAAAAPGLVSAPASTPVESSPLGRSRRNVIRVNYAEATDEALGGGADSGKKRRASQSPAAPRSIARPKSLMKLLNRSAAKRAGKGGDSDDEAPVADEADGAAKIKGRTAKTLSFGAAQKVQTVTSSSKPSPRYVTNFLIACEQICSRDAVLLHGFHQHLAKMHLGDLATLVNAMEKVFDKAYSKDGKDGARIVERIQTQLHALGPHGAPHEDFVLKSARTPLRSLCRACKKESWLTTICSECRKHAAGQLELLPYLDWSSVMQKQSALDAEAAVAAAKAAEKQVKKKVNDAESSPSASPDSSSSSEPLPSFPLAAPASPNKRAKLTPAASPSSSPKARASSAVSSSSDSADTAAWVLEAREALSVRACYWIRDCMMNCSKADFAFSGGDIIFLLRNAIFKGRGKVSAAARDVVSQMLRRWDESTCTILSVNSEPAHVMVFAECLHAKREMQWGTPEELDDLVLRMRAAVGAHCAEDILRFDATRHFDKLPQQAYCKPCGTFQKGSKGMCPNEGCGKLLRAEDDYEFLTESLVWTSLFRELSIDPVVLADASVRFEDMLRLVKLTRPYQSLDQRGVDSYRLQCYYLTHLTFVLTRWGGCRMSPRPLFVEEYLFLLANMDVVIAMGDPELVGELLQALHILDTPHSHPAMQKGYHFMLGCEKKGKMRGNWVSSAAPFYQKYHAAYCGIIGLAEFEFDKPDESMPKEYARFFM